jgi:hypothetical protein
MAKVKNTHALGGLLIFYGHLLLPDLQTWKQKILGMKSKSQAS